VISSGMNKYLNESLRIPNDCDVKLTRVLVSRNKTELEVMGRVEFVVVKGAFPVLSASLRAFYEEPQLAHPLVLERGYAVFVKLEMDPDTVEDVKWPLSVQLIGTQHG